MAVVVPLASQRRFRSRSTAGNIRATALLETQRLDSTTRSGLAGIGAASVQADRPLSQTPVYEREREEEHGVVD